jgi:hypothetical protein
MLTGGGIGEVDRVHKGGMLQGQRLRHPTLDVAARSHEALVAQHLGHQPRPEIGDRAAGHRPALREAEAGDRGHDNVEGVLRPSERRVDGARRQRKSATWSRAQSAKLRAGRPVTSSTSGHTRISADQSWSAYPPAPVGSSPP